MLGHLGEILSSDEFMPHGMCFLWRPDLLWLHAGSDILIALAYYSIPIALLYFVQRRKDLVFPVVFILFGAFIFACGTTHVMSVWTIWRPDYWLDGAIKAATAAVSVLAAVLVWRVMPAALALPNRGQLEAANRVLADQVAERARNAEAVRRLNQELEQRVVERTADLEVANEQLRTALAEKDVLLCEVQHRVKNNLQVVSGLLTLQVRNVPDAVKPYLHESLERIRAMGRVHQQLYQAENSATFSVDQLIRDICADLGHTDGTVRERVGCRVVVPGPISLPLDLATPLALIVNEVLANAFKHAYPDDRAGEIVVALAETAEGVRLEIRDDGIGLADDHASRGRQSIGFRLIRMLANQIGAAASWSSSGGTTFALVVPQP